MCFNQADQQERRCWNNVVQGKELERKEQVAWVGKQCTAALEERGRKSLLKCKIWCSLKTFYTSHTHSDPLCKALQPSGSTALRVGLEPYIC